MTTTHMRSVYHRRWKFKKRYGITLHQYNQLLEAQNGVCLLCRQPETREVRGSVTRLTVDHDHETGAVRGLLCSRCNRVLGLIEDDPDWLRRAAIYIVKARHYKRGRHPLL